MALLRSDILSKELLTRAVSSIEHTENVEVIEVDIDTEEILKLSQELRRVSVKALVRRKEKTYDFVAKLSPASDTLAEQALDRQFWEREQWVLNELITDMKISSPFLYFTEKTGLNTCLLFSDLMSEGFLRPDPLDSKTRTVTVSLLVETLAQIHAAGYLLLKKLAEKEEPRPLFLHNTIPYPDESCLTTYPLESEKTIRLKALLHSESFHKRWDLAFCPRSSGLVTICQGSPVPKNCLVWFEDDGAATEASFVDYMDARCCQPATDLAILLHSWLNKDERIEMASTLLKSYHDQFLKCLEKAGESGAEAVYPFSMLVEDYSAVLLPAIILSMVEGWGEGKKVLADRTGDQVDGKNKPPGVDIEEIMEAVEKFQL